MGDVINIESKLPHLSGKAVCLNCKFEWVAVAPLGTIALECSECGLFKGVFAAMPAPDMAWHCPCGTALFYVTPNGNMCAHCAMIQEF